VRCRAGSARGWSSAGTDREDAPLGATAVAAWEGSEWGIGFLLGFTLLFECRVEDGAWTHMIFFGRAGKAVAVKKKLAEFSFCGRARMGHQDRIPVGPSWPSGT